MSDLTDELWAKGFTPVNGERWSNRDRERLRLMHDEIKRLTAENERLRNALLTAQIRIQPWINNCDYRAEPDLRDANSVINRAISDAKLQDKDGHGTDCDCSACCPN